MKQHASRKLDDALGKMQISLKESWSNIFHVFFRDLKRLATNPIAAFVIVFILVFPCLYAWIGTNAYWDPYSNTSGLKIAIVNEDKPADTGIAGEIDLGSMIVDALGDIPLLGWDFTDRNDASEKLDSGLVYSMIVIPQDFSENFAKLFKDSKNRTNIHFDYYINERENGAAVKIFDIASSTIEEQINQKFIQTVSGILSVKAKEVTGDVANTATNSTKSVSSKVSNIADGVNDLNKVLNSGDVVIAQVQETLKSSQILINDVKNQASGILNIANEGISTCNNLRQKVSNAIKELEERGIKLELIYQILNNLESSIDQDLSALNSVAQMMYQLDSTCNQVLSLISQTNNIVITTDSISDTVRTKVNDVYNKLNNLSTVIGGDLASSPFVLKALIDSNTENLGTFMSTPVSMENHVINEVKLYGIGAAPFFSNLTLWIAGLVLIALFRSEVDPPKRKNWNSNQAYISRGMLFSFVAILIGIVCAIGDFLIGVQCENPGLFVITCVIASFTFTSIIYMLSACFKHVGKAIAVVLIIMQIPGSSGMFPVAMMPQAYQAISPFLPFTYGIAAMRECIISPNYGFWSWDIFILLVFFIVSFLIGIYARAHLINLNKLFDKKLARTGLMECDANDHMSNKEDSLSSLIDVFIKIQTDDEVIKDLSTLKLKYKKKKRFSLIMLWLLPLSLLVGFSVIFYFVDVDINTKIILLMVWLLAIIACCSYVIVLEFKHNRLKTQYKVAMDAYNEENK